MLCLNCSTRGGRSSCLVYYSTPIGLNLAHFEIFTGSLSHTAEQYRSSTHQFEFKMVAASVIPLKERKSFHHFLLKHLNLELKIELFLLQWMWLNFLLKSTCICKHTPYNVGSVLWRLFSTLEVVQYIGGITSVLWG